MDEKLLLAKTITLLYRERENLKDTESVNVDSVTLATEVLRLVSKKNEHQTIQDFTGKDPLIELRNTLSRMVSHKNNEKFGKTDLMQKLVMDTDGDIALYKSLEMGIEPDLSEEERLEFCNDLRKSIRDAIDDFTYEAYFKAAYIAIRRGDSNLRPMDLIEELYKKVDGYRKTKPASFTASKSFSEVDISCDESLDKMVETMNKVTAGELGLQTGMVQINEMAGPTRKFNRGEMILIPAKSHGYKSGTVTALFRQFAMHNKPFLLDKTKKPLMILWSVEQNLWKIFEMLYRAVFFLINGYPADDSPSKEDLKEYVRVNLGRTGYHIKVIRSAGEETNYAFFMEVIEHYISEGFEVHSIGLDYMEKMSTAGCEIKAMGYEYKDLAGRLRSFIIAKNILLYTPHQFNGEARMVIQNTKDPIRRLAGSGVYYARSKDLYQEIDVEIVCNLRVINTETYLEYYQGKNRSFGDVPEANKYVIYPLCPETGLRDDIDADTPYGSRTPPRTAVADGFGGW